MSEKKAKKYNDVPVVDDEDRFIHDELSDSVDETAGVYDDEDLKNEGVVQDE